MSDDFDSFRCRGGFSSPQGRGAGSVSGCPDPQQPRDIADGRKTERARLRASRLAMTVSDRKAAGEALGQHLQRILKERFRGAQGMVLSAYWPIKGEPDLRPLMHDLHETGVVIALPLVETRAAPLTFRRWTPDTRMVRGDWNIPVPAPEAPVIVPQIALAPLVGWTRDGYRLGYGGGYFDRTLAVLTPKPVTIGIGFEAAELSTIHPQAHDICLDMILTEAGLRAGQGRT